MTLDDEKYCLQEMSKGNKSAFEWLFVTWHPKLVDFLTRLLDEEATAYDYAQDIFFDIWKQRRKFSEVDSFSAYLFQMARFKVYNHYDKGGVKKRFREEVSRREPAGAPAPELSLYARETESIIRNKVIGMPSRRRRVFIMSRMQGYSNDQIATELGIDKRTVENHLSNALAELRKVVK